MLKLGLYASHLIDLRVGYDQVGEAMNKKSRKETLNRGGGEETSFFFSER